MIAVVAPPEECDVVRELFELFKTPWEFYQPDREYEVILAPAATAPAEKIPLRILFGPEFAPGEEELATGEQKQGVSLHLAEGCLPIYGSCLVFDALRPVLAVANHQGSAAIVQLIEQGTTVRLGYDLYAEIRYLLVNGQPDFNARIPSLDQHIALLREFIVNSGIPLVEIPPVPAGYPFSVCLTHDVDNPLVRNHRTDNTALGFLLRATLGSVLNTIRGRMTIRHLLKNLSAACLFPFVQLGLARDFWGDFDRYLEIEGGLSSTFFVIPERGNPGWNVCARHPARRACAYTLEQINPQISRILKNGGEIALHGINAWTDLERGRAERARIASAIGHSEIGVRMHWLCFDEAAPSVLDAAGFTYDSTSGYNGTVGYRAGTLQAFRPLGVRELLELPLHIMDTAMFYPSHLNLRSQEAAQIARQCFTEALRFGGLLTLNWHDRSIAPERQWEDFYVKMLAELKGLAPWFATASQATTWFRRRRSVVFEEIRHNGRVVKVKVTTKLGNGEGLPGLRIRVTPASAWCAGLPLGAADHSSSWFEREFLKEAEISQAA